MSSFEATIYLHPGEIRLNRKGSQRLQKNWKDARAALIQDLRNEFRGHEMFEGSIVLHVEEHWPEGGDIDAPLKGLLDAITKAGIWVDDDQVCRLVVEKKVWRKSPLLKIRIEEV